ncbi:hypothetical protein C7999DRAFT_31680 [Corynascus novoguineensis]|uniref:Uncharacterized protein n=1 Tax=Corynascus novoguineensis TaxID=1126955 RepID=A0AAN7CT48_9PEZI|nr:hypothetical protein C7999DRAFT_31680 [Corynascus novoguineensis]
MDRETVARNTARAAAATRAKSDTCYVVSHMYNHDLPLRHISSDSLAKAVLAEWYATAAYLAAHITPGQLELTLVCDVHHTRGAETAEAVLDSLALLPRLKDCHI